MKTLKTNITYISVLLMRLRGQTLSSLKLSKPWPCAIIQNQYQAFIYARSSVMCLVLRLSRGPLL